MAMPKRPGKLDISLTKKLQRLSGSIRIGFAFARLVPLPDVEGALEETSYVLGKLGAVGLKVATNMGGIYPGDPHSDIAGDPEPVQLSTLRMVAADDHIVYESDFPHSPTKVVVAKKKHFDENREYDGIKEKIYGENAIRLLKGSNA